MIVVFSPVIRCQVPDRYDLKGKVTDEENNPLNYVNVTIQELSVSSKSDKNGEFVFTGILSGSYHITFTLSGYLNKSEEFKLSKTTQYMNIKLEKGLIETSTIDVTGTFNPTEISNSTFSVTSINPRAINKYRSENIASTIQNVPGINNLSTGTTIGKPVIRGLSYQSVLVLHDGVKHESQLWGDEHGPEIPVYNIERIEILRGPSSLMYGSDGIGGVVNIITKPLQFSSDDKLLKYGNLVFNGFSMNNQLSANLNLGIGTANTGIQGFAGLRKGSDIKTPSGSLAVNTPYGINNVSGGILSNSGDQEFQAGINAGFKTSFANISFSFENFNRELQLHENPEIDPEATPNQKIVTNNLDLKGEFPLSSSYEIETVFSYENQNRIEYENIYDKENGIEALNLTLKLFQGDVRFHHKSFKNLNGTLGLSLRAPSNRSVAEEKLIPNYNAGGIGVYWMENLELKKFTFSGGIRYDAKSIYIKETVLETDTLGNPVNTIDSRDLGFESFSYSFGAVFRINSFSEIFSNIGTGWRPPSEYELFVDGVHEGTGRYEKGLITLNPSYSPSPENSVNFDIGTRIRYRYFSAEISLYSNRISNFVFPASTGVTDSASGFQIFNILQDNSLFRGYEYSLQIQPVNWLIFTLKGDYVYTKNFSSDSPLPLTPPAKNIAEIKFQKDNFGGFFNPYFLFGLKFVSKAYQTGELEASTPAYNIFNTGFGFDYMLKNSVASFDFEVTNLFNIKYTDHLSRYRYYAMNAGRSFNLKVNIPFEVK